MISHRGVRTPRYKLIEFYTRGEWEFYDLDRDPLEMHSEYDNPEYEKVVSDMERELRKLMAEHRLGQ